MPRILVVDDDEAMREVIKDNLSLTHDVVETGRSETALAMTLEHKPDAILLDLSMPGLSGFELCQILSSLRITQQIPIFIVSAEDERNAAYCQNLGAYRYFRKPIDFARLKTDLAWALSSKQGERRADPRIAIRVMLTLKGKNKDGTIFVANAATENMSKGGFLCTCTSLLEEGTTVEVTLRAEREHNLGRARVVRVVRSAGLDPRYGFQFIGTSKHEVLNRTLEGGA